MFGIGSLELLVLAVLVVLALGLVARRGANAPDRAERSSRVVQAAWWGCVIYGAVVVPTTLLGVVSALTDDTVTVEAPIEEFWPELPPGMEVDDGEVPGKLVAGSMTSATLEVAGLATSTRVLLAAGELVSGLTIAAVVVLVALACRNIGRGTPFAPVLARACGVAAVAVALGSTISQLLTEIGTSRAAEAALGWTSASWSCSGKGCADFSPDQYVPASVWSLHFELWPLAVALVLGVVAVLLRSGAALQRETDGLV